ncbi:unnamed protein product [Euphydryas editha]|uniref:BED-type domain-containing protein n=1 Tax=Euphydryas editha TaxID=104508 RepID=A0AAU9VDB3_EUPED|nr:unnamed protein product [Euphydryas editha]
MSGGGDRKSSKAWQFFTDLQNDKTRCNFCQKEFSYKGGGAYNLTRHTKSKHPQAFIAIRESERQIESDPLPSTSTTASTAISELIEPTNPPNKEIFKHKSAAANTKLRRLSEQNATLAVFCAVF